MAYSLEQIQKAILTDLVLIKEKRISLGINSINENSKQRVEDLKFYLPLITLHSIEYLNCLI
jgi:hypothetical protein